MRPGRPGTGLPTRNVNRSRVTRKISPFVFPLRRTGDIGGRRGDLDATLRCPLCLARCGRPGWVFPRLWAPRHTADTGGARARDTRSHRESKMLTDYRSDHTITSRCVARRPTFAAHRRARTARTRGPSQQCRTARLTPSSRASGRRPFSRRRHGERAQRPLQRP